MGLIEELTYVPTFRSRKLPQQMMHTYTHIDFMCVLYVGFHVEMT